MGRHKRAYYRIVATDSRNKVQGGYIELLGQYDPLTDDIKIKEEAILKFLSQGAQPSDTVKNILKDKGVWAKFIATKSVKKPTVKKEKKVVAKKTTVKKTVDKKQIKK